MEDIFDKKIVSAAKPNVNIGIDQDDKTLEKIVETGDTDGIASLSTVALERDLAYNQIDDMCADSRIASVLEAYTEDVACMGQDGRIVYVDSLDPNVSKIVTHFLDAMNIDKYIYSWGYSLIKYGDVYIRLYRKSEVGEEDETRPLNESVEINYFNPIVDKYSDYCAQVQNPAEMFELKQFGKTCLYIQCPLSSLQIRQRDRTRLSYYVQYKDNDTKIFQPSSFVHGCLNQSFSRAQESMQLFGDSDDNNSEVYTVARGQSLFYNTYPTWRQLQLLENAMLLNRINNSSVLRVMQVEVGNLTSEEEITSVTTSVKNMLQDKLSLSAQKMSNLYLSDQPTVNYAVMPVKNGNGQLSSFEMGGSLENNNTDDMNYFRDKLYAALRIPKQYMGENGGDSAGFDAGGSLAQLSMRYGKAVRRIQNALIQMITDLINLRLVDRGLSKYINKFQIKMHFPITQEDTVNQTHKKEQVDLVLRIMEALDDIADENAKLSILRFLMSTVIDDSDVLTAIQSEITKQEEVNDEQEEENQEENEPQSSVGLSDELEMDAGR